MDINSQNVEQIVRQVLQEMSGKTAAATPCASSSAIPEKSRVAMLTALEK